MLVLGGSLETDHLMTEPTDVTDLGLQLHYTFQTAGSILQYKRVSRRMFSCGSMACS